MLCLFVSQWLAYMTLPEAASGWAWLIRSTFALER